jgi:hypothetical protein
LATAGELARREQRAPTLALTAAAPMERPALAAAAERRPMRVEHRRPRWWNRRRRGMTASAVRLNPGDNDTLRRLQQGWQSRAFAYYDLIPEIWYASQFYARALQALEIYVGKVDPDTGEIEKVDDERVQEYVTRIQDPGGGRANLLGAFGRLQFIAGECYLLVTLDDDGEEVWEMLSTDELRPTGEGSFTRYKAPSLNAEELKEVTDDMWQPIEGFCVAYRIWRRHPRYSALADAPMKAVLELCEELLLLTKAVRARALSRAAGAGMLLIPEEISLPADEAVGEEDAEEDPFFADLETHLQAPLNDAGSASAVVPLIVRASGEYIDKIRHLSLADPTKFYPETGLRTECIHRMALGLDLPPEVLLGTADANHWTSWQIDEQTWKAHLQPVAQMLVGDLTAAYLRQALKADGFVDYRDYVVAYDASAIINHPDRSKDAKDLYAEGVLNGEALRKANGFDETDAPDEAEWRRWAGVKMRDSSVAIYGIPSKLGTGGIETAPGVVEDGQAATPAGSTGTDAPTVEPTVDVAPSNGATPAPRTGSAAAVEGAIAVALERCRELAGARLVSRARGIEEAQPYIADVPNRLVPASLGRARATTLCPGMTERKLVAGGSETLAGVMLGWGYAHADVAKVCQDVERHAALTLWRRDPMASPGVVAAAAQADVEAREPALA